MVEDLDIFTSWVGGVTNEEQLWIRAIHVGQCLHSEPEPDAHLDPNAWVLQQLLHLGVWDWSHVHRPDSVSTRAMRYAAALADVQEQMLRAERAKVILLISWHLCCRLMR